MRLWPRILRSGSAPYSAIRPLFALGAVLLLFDAQTAAATSLAAYKDRVQQAVVALDLLSSAGESGGNPKSNAPPILQAVRSILPKSEKVEWGSSSVVIDNSWLEDSLQKYEAALTSDPKNADYQRARIVERLHALGERLNELDGSSHAVDKEAEKGKMASILRGPEYNRKPDEPSALSLLWKRFKEWLASLFPKQSEIEPGQPTVISRLAEIVVMALALAVIVLVVLKFAPRFLRRTGGKKREKAKARVILGEQLAPDDTGADLLAQAEQLAREGNIRAAIRKGYIALLCELGDRKIVRLQQSNTNRDYLLAVREHGGLHGFMQVLTTSFENHWYGFRPATEADWSAFRAGYYEMFRT